MTIQKIEAHCPEAQSANLVAENIEKLKALFPELLTETVVNGQTTAALNMDVLKALVGDATVTDSDEKYGLNWHGKRRARQIALTPSTGTLRPAKDESVDWDTTQNLMIEGDNLEVLKLLQKSYAGKVKLIYIDPPYNTGKDFVYPDNFQDNIKNYLELTSQSESGTKVTTNTEASGRFHTDWLNMIYPRVKIARDFLSDDGVIFISVDDCEVSNLRKILDEIFGEENFVGCVVWQKKYSPQNDAKHISELHEYIVAYAKKAELWRANLLPRSEEATARYKNIDNDPRGPWKAGDLTTKTKAAGHSYPITSPSGKVFLPTAGRQWGPSIETFTKMLAENRIWFGQNGSNVPAMKQFLSEVQDGTVPTSLWMRDLVGDNQIAVRQLAEIGIPFDSPKPVGLIQHILKISTKADDKSIVMDFFAGSGSTAHAVLKQNFSDNGNRRYLLVQLPENLDLNDKNQKDAANFCINLNKPLSIAEITKERIRRAAQQIKGGNQLFTGDLGFRTFKLDSSNIRVWNSRVKDLKTALFENLEHIEPERSNDDVLYEVLLKLGLDLCVPMEAQQIAGKTVHSIGGGALMTCLDAHIGVADAEGLALGMAQWREAQGTATETTAVFRDSAFENDVAKSNLAAILEQHGIKHVRSL
jgi:adenine-specific DNA-methyltransferase